jgi:hypothetical protein
MGLMWMHRFTHDVFSQPIEQAGLFDLYPTEELTMLSIESLKKFCELENVLILIQDNSIPLANPTRDPIFGIEYKLVPKRDFFARIQPAVPELIEDPIFLPYKYTVKLTEPLNLPVFQKPVKMWQNEYIQVWH